MLSLMKVCARTTRKLQSKCKKLWGASHISPFYVSKGLLRIKLCNESVCIITHDLKKLFPGNSLIIQAIHFRQSINWQSITSYWLILISIFVELITVQVCYFHWTYHSKLAIFGLFAILKTAHLFFAPFLQICNQADKLLTIYNKCFLIQISQY